MTAEEMTLEEIEQAAAGVFGQSEQAENNSQEDDPEAEAQQDEEAQPEGEPEAEGQQDDEEPEDEEGAAQDDEEEKEKEEKPRMNRASQRVKEAVDRANRAEQRMQELEFKFQQQMKANEELMKLITGGEGQSDSESKQSGEDEILDEALAKKMEERFGKLEDQQFSNVKAQELGYVGGERGETYQKAVAASAVSVMRKAEALGKSVNPEQAEQMAKEAIEKEMREMHKRGARPGAIAHELANAASYYDYLISQQQTGNQSKAGQKPKKGVNMKKVDEARQKAGAPTIDKESVNIQGGENVLAKEAEKLRGEGYDPDYLAKMGLA